MRRGEAEEDDGDVAWYGPSDWWYKRKDQKGHTQKEREKRREEREEKGLV